MRDRREGPADPFQIPRFEPVVDEARLVGVLQRAIDGLPEADEGTCRIIDVLVDAELAVALTKLESQRCQADRQLDALERRIVESSLQIDLLQAAGGAADGEEKAPGKRAPLMGRCRRSAVKREGLQ